MKPYGVILTRNPGDFLWLTRDRPAVDISAPAAAAGHRNDATTGLIQRRLFLRILYQASVRSRVLDVFPGIG